MSLDGLGIQFASINLPIHGQLPILLDSYSPHVVYRSTVHASGCQLMRALYDVGVLTPHSGYSVLDDQHS
jgi:hypothetical protein